MLAMTFNEERRVATELSPRIAWPTLRLAVFLPLAQAGLIAAAILGAMPFWLAVLPLGYIHFAYYTLVHESIHGNVVRDARYAWVHRVLGWWGALNMMTSYPALRRIHLLHHQHTNTDADPDYNLCHGPLWKSVGRVIFLRTLLLLPLPIVRLVPAASYTIKQARLTDGEMKIHAITVTALQLVFWIAVALGYAKVALLLYWVPMMIGLVLLNVFFQWLPHVPFEKTDRYHKAGVYWPVAHRILLGQNLHLGHHLWPSVPFYNYRPLNDRLRSQFESAGARIHGFLPSGWTGRGSATAAALDAPPVAVGISDQRPPTRAQLHALIAPYAKASSFQGYKSFAIDLALYALGIGTVLFFESFAMKVAGGIVAGAALVNLGALLHEAAHRAVVRSRTGNKIIAVVSMTLCLFNFRLWIYDHHVLHHARTNVKGNNFLSPITLAEYRGMSRLRRALYRAFHTPSGAGILLYFLIERWPTVHFYPGAWLPPRFRRSALGYTALLAAYAAALLAVLTFVPALRDGSVVASLVCGFVLPYAIWFATFSMTVFLQHTHPQVRWYGDTASSPPEALSVHVVIPHWINHMSHYGLEHPVHHVSAAIPHYRLKAAQAALAGIATPAMIVMRFTAANLRNVLSRCRLYDYEAHAWMDFSGEVTALPLERGPPQAGRPASHDLLPDQADPTSPGIFFPAGREHAEPQRTVRSARESA